jgi:hypothetical protein
VRTQSAIQKKEKKKEKKRKEKRKENSMAALETKFEVFLLSVTIKLKLSHAMEALGERGGIAPANS